MPPDVLTAVTAEQLEVSPAPLVYYDVIHRTGFDPWEPWYPCGCDGRLEDSHEDDCFMGWLRPRWVFDPTAELPTVSEVDDGPEDEDAAVYLERHHHEPTSDVDGEEVPGADVSGDAEEVTVDDADG